MVRLVCYWPPRSLLSATALCRPTPPRTTPLHQYRAVAKRADGEETVPFWLNRCFICDSRGRHFAIIKNNVEQDVMLWIRSRKFRR